MDTNMVNKDNRSIIGMNTSAGMLVVCYAPAMITTDGIWQGDNPLDYSLPLFILQLAMIVVTTRVLVFLLKPLRQPRVNAEILGGILLGPSVLGSSKTFASTMFPLRSLMVLETMANMGLLYFLFLVGVEMDVSIIKRAGKKSVFVAITGMILPFLTGVAFSFILLQEDVTINRGTYILFLSVALSVTAFPVLARILAEIKLINTEVGKLAMSSALINDICSWILLAIAISLAENDNASLASLWVVLSSAAFVGVCVLVVRPTAAWMIRRTPEGETFSDFYVCLILTGVMISGFITDAIGTHSVFGAFVFGLAIPNGPLGVTLIEKLEDFISGLLLPLYFAMSGLRTDIGSINGAGTWMLLFIVIILGCAGKVAGTLLVTIFYEMPLKEGFVLGLLMNTKGLIEMVVLNLGLSQKVLNDRTFAIMIIVSIVMTGVITPLVTSIYKPMKKGIGYKRRTIEGSRPDSEFRFLVCVHNPKNVPTMINILDASHPTKQSPICIYVLHLVELTGRASAMLIVHNTRKSGYPALNRTQAQSDHIIHAFESYEQQADFVSVQPLTAISPYSTMHEDICSLAEDKRVALIVIPFHKQLTVDGSMETTNQAYRIINQNVLVNAPCSVGILVDRGFSISTRTSHRIAVLFFGGPDDREALVYGWRMAEHPGLRLTVMRFTPGEEADQAAKKLSEDPINNPDKMLDADMINERMLDELLLKAFRSEHSDNELITYVEKVVNNGEETVTAIRTIDSSHDLFIVGRGQGGIAEPITAGLTDWSECPELGAIGDLLASSDFATTVSVLVIQQYVAVGEPGEGIMIPDSPTTPDEHYASLQMADRRERYTRSMEDPVFHP